MTTKYISQVNKSLDSIQKMLKVLTIIVNTVYKKILNYLVKNIFKKYNIII